MAFRKKPGATGCPPSMIDQSTVAGKVGARLRRLRISRDMTLQDVCDRTGGAVSTNMLSCYEVGGMEPRLTKYLAICVALGADLQDLLPDGFLSELRQATPRDLRKIIYSGKDKK
jgi:transcriptional regulator with XRE-family HTH domain